MFDVVMAELRSIYDARADETHGRGRAAEDDLRKWGDLMSLSRAALCDQIATYLARGFDKYELSYGFCDGVVNDLFWLLLAADELPDLFYEAYEAFDMGEWSHGQDQDPVEVYTRPAIARLVEKLAPPRMDV